MCKHLFVFEMCRGMQLCTWNSQIKDFKHIDITCLYFGGIFVFLETMRMHTFQKKPRTTG